MYFYLFYYSVKTTDFNYNDVIFWDPPAGGPRVLNCLPHCTAFQEIVSISQLINISHAMEDV